MTTGARVIWGGVVALQLGHAAGEAVRSWAAPRGLRRLLLVHGPGGRPEALIPHLETAGLAVFAFEHPGGPSVAAVAEAVAAYHFDQCDAMVAIGGGAAVDLATLAAFMAGQRHPLPDLAADPSAVDPRGVASCLAVATDPTGLAALGGARVLIDDRGCPFLIRDPLLRPGAAVWCPLSGGDGLRAPVVALALDAGDAEAAERLIAAGPEDVPEIALTVAGLLERRLGPARAFAAFAEVAGELPPGPTLAAVLRGVGGPESTLSFLSRALDPDGTGRAGLDCLPLDGLAHLDPATLPVDISGVLVMLGRDIPARRRRGGRGGAARGRRSE
ncbi:iron-containing alcohol dehydrogenase [Thalassobaculum salexigens]|uniref:iron-containing alcohol dehydrogenase n=1 Tax=Thalassobaculum salexigens TaxID=455360 RepID=UPI0004251F38|nr:iron-containing alcohol dehydrogenase [Thalassobaculum salexigens]